MNITPLIKFFSRLHKKGAETQPDEFSELLILTKDILNDAKEHSVTVNPRDLYRINLNTEMDNLGVAIECLEALVTAMGSEGDDKYIDVPTFNKGFCNSRPITLDRLLIDQNQQWLRYTDAVETLINIVYQLEVQLKEVDNKMLDYYRGHAKRILTRVYNIFKQL